MAWHQNVDVQKNAEVCAKTGGDMCNAIQWLETTINKTTAKEHLYQKVEKKLQSHKLFY